MSNHESPKLPPNIDAGIIPKLPATAEYLWENIPTGPDGVKGNSDSSFAAVVGVNSSKEGGEGVVGSSASGPGVEGRGEPNGVVGKAGHNGSGVYGVNPRGIGIAGDGDIGVLGRGRIGGSFVGWVVVKGDMQVSGDIWLTNADCAEDFAVTDAEKAAPGTVMVIEREGVLQRSSRPYDRKVAGVVSGAGDFRPGIVLGRPKRRDDRMPIALVGRVNCLVDADYAPIDIGDPLTTSATPGHAMRAVEPDRGFGAVLGKALRPLRSGRDLIPVLVALQ